MPIRSDALSKRGNELNSRTDCNILPIDSPVLTQSIEGGGAVGGVGLSRLFNTSLMEKSLYKGLIPCL